MVRLSLDMCAPDLANPADVYQDTDAKRLLMKRGVPLTPRAKELLAKHDIKYLEFPLPFETSNPPPYTFSEETENALFCLVRDAYEGFQRHSISEPHQIRKDAYAILAQAFDEFCSITKSEKRLDDKPSRRHPGSILHLRTVGGLEDYLIEHSKNVSLLCLVLGHDFFRASDQILAEIHKTAVAGLFADISMVKLPFHLMQKKEDLNDEDWKQLHSHPETSARFVESLFRQKNFITAQIVLHHHERRDGSGYPAGLRLNHLEPHSLLLAVADTYTSMISKRYFRTAHKPVEKMKHINEQSGALYDENAVSCLNYRIAPYPIGTVAEFSGKRLVQVTGLENIPTDIEKLITPKELASRAPYNSPKTIRLFKPQGAGHAVKSVPLKGRINLMGSLVDTYDLLALYGYTQGSE